MIRFVTFTKVSGRLIPLTSLVDMTSGMYIKGTVFDAILNMVPNIPHIVTGIKSKLKIYDAMTMNTNCLIKCDSGLTLK